MEVESIDIYSLLKKGSLQSVEIESFLYIDNKSMASELRKFSGELSKLYYQNITTFMEVKKNLWSSFLDYIYDEKSIGYLYICFPVDVDLAFELFESNVLGVDGKWLDHILSGPVGRSPEKVKNILYSIDCQKLKDCARSSFIRYLVSDKCLFSIQEAREVLQKENIELLINAKKDITLANNESLRIAVLVSGQMRGFETALRSWEKFFSGHNLTYFIHTWRKNGVSTKGFDRFKRFYPSIVGDNFQRIESEGKTVYEEECFSRIMDKITPVAEVSNEVLKAAYGMTSKVVVEEDVIGLTNSERMYYKMSKSFDLIDDPSEYDLIVRVRPDLVIESSVSLDINKIKEMSVNSNSLFAEYGYTSAYYGFGVDDKLAIGSPEVMGVYHQLWGEYVKAEKVDKLLGHISLAKYLFEKDINVLPLNKYIKTYMCDHKIIGADTSCEISNFLRR